MVVFSSIIMTDSVYAETRYAENMTATDEKARKTDGNAGNSDSKLVKYLSIKYKDQLDKDGNHVVSYDEIENNSFSGKLEIYGPNSSVTTDSEELKEITKNMVQFNSLDYFKNVKEIVIDGVDEIRNTYLPVNLEKLTIKNSTLNLSRDSGYYKKTYPAGSAAGLFNCPNLEELTLENDTIGTMYLRQNIEGWVFLKQFELPLYNNTKLKKLNVSINFVNDEQTLLISAGSDVFESLTENNCNIVTSGDGRLIVDSSNPNSAFSKKYRVIEGVEFENRLFREMIIGDTNADKNGDGILTQAELNTIESLTIDNDHLKHTRPNLDTCTIYNDLEKLQQLKELTIQQDYHLHTARLINEIKFPDSLEKLSIINTRLNLNDSKIPGVKTLVLDNVQPINVSVHLNVEVDDTNGNLESVSLNNSEIESLIADNHGTKGKLSISAVDAIKLTKVEFKTNSYTLVGENSFVGCTSLKSIGYNAAANQWNLDCSNSEKNFDIDFTNCTNLTDESNKIRINCATSSGKNADLVFYSTSSLYGNNLAIERSGTGNVRLLVDSADETPWSEKYKQADGFNVSATSSDPDVCVFDLGNELNLNTEGYVDRWDVVVQTGTNFTNSCKYYVMENGKSRRVVNLPTGSSVVFRMENPAGKTVASFHYADAYHNFDTNDSGYARVVAYLVKTVGGTTVEKEIGSVRIRVTAKADSISANVISPVNNEYSPVDSYESEENPIYIEGDGKAAFTAIIHPENDIVQDVLWMIDYENSDGAYSKFSTASPQGIKVSSDSNCSYPTSTKGGTLTEEQIDKSKTDKTIREFYFPNTLSDNFRKIRLTAQANLKKDGVEIKKSWYLSIKDPCDISLTNEGKIVYGVRDMESVTATISGVRNKDTLDVSIKDESQYNDCIILNKISEGDSSVKYEIKINSEKSSEAISSVFESNDEITLQIKADYGYQEKTLYFDNNVFSITYELNGGTNNSDNPDKYVAREKVIELKEPTKEGYSFAGWYLDDQKVTAIDTSVSGYITLVAKWSDDSNQEEPKDISGAIKNEAGITAYVDLETLMKAVDLSELSAEDQQKLEEGKKLNIELVIANNENISSESKEKIDEKLLEDDRTKEKENVKVERYLDISLLRFFDGEESDAKKITQTKSEIEISITVPDDIYDSEKDYAIARNHNGDVTIIGRYDSESRKIKFSTTDFSDYAIISWKAEKKEDKKEDKEEDSKKEDKEKIDKNKQEPSEKEKETASVDYDLLKSELDAKVVLVSFDNTAATLTDFKVHSLDKNVAKNQELLAKAQAEVLGKNYGIENPKIKVIWSYGIYPRRDLSVTESGSKQILKIKLDSLKDAPKAGTLVYAQCYSQNDGTYLLVGLVDTDGYAVFNNFILRDVVNTTIFTVE